MVPSWKEEGEAGSEGFAFSFGVYDREDADELDLRSPHSLVNECSRAQLRGLELAHMVGRRLLRSDREVEELQKDLDKARTERISLRDQLVLAEGRLSSLQGGIDAEAASQLLARNAELEAAARRLDVQNAELQTSIHALEARHDELAREALSPSPCRGKVLTFSEREFEQEMQKNAAAVADLIFLRLKHAQILTADAARLTAAQVAPELFEPVVDSEGESEHSDS